MICPSSAGVWGAASGSCAATPSLEPSGGVLAKAGSPKSKVSGSESVSEIQIELFHKDVHPKISKVPFRKVCDTELLPPKAPLSA